MALVPGTRIGSYEIVSQIGAGGMGEVYRATDTRLGRDVAIKVLPDVFAHDPQRLARLEREARTLAALNHPNVAIIHGLEQIDSSHAIVMELVEGPTLADRIGRGPLPLKEALTIARQIADALEAAHERGIIHRDLKPANVTMASSGAIKVLDFGLAKIADATSGGDVAGTATTALAATREGVVLGTAAYMSPEQARGEPVDKRADIWAFGCVLFEMLTGRSAFGHTNIGDTIAAVIDREPDWTRLPADTPEPLRRMLRRCLEKDVKRRLRDIGDAGSEIDELLSAATPPAIAANRPRRQWWPVAAGAAIAAIAAAGWFIWSNRPGAPTAAPELRLEITTPVTNEPLSLAVSPDGLSIVFAATADNETGLWLRQLSSGAVRALAGTDQAKQPFWSPDGRAVAFFAAGKLKRIDVTGGGAQTLADAPDARGGVWADDGIFFSPTRISPVHRVSAAGGDNQPVTRLEQGHLGHVFPQVLRRAGRLMYYVSGDAAVSGTWTAREDGSDPRRVLPRFGPAIDGPAGYVLYTRDDALFGQAFDAAAVTSTGDPIRVADGLFPSGRIDGAPVSASARGTLAFRSRPPQGDRQLIWFDRAGTEVGRVAAPAAGAQGPALSPDGRYLAISRPADDMREIWMLELQRSVLTRLTSSAGNKVRPLWTPDGNRVVFSSNRSGTLAVYEQDVSGGLEQPVVVTDHNSVANDISPDGATLVYLVADPKTLLDIWARPLGAGGQAYSLVQTAGEDLNGQIAPNGGWLAYQSNASGRYEISVKSLRDGARPTQVSTAGGTQPRWRRDARELYYLDLQGRLTAAPVAFANNGQSVTVGTPQPLFQTRIGGANINQAEYLVSRDGQRFLLDTPFAEFAPPITVILNWRAPTTAGAQPR